MFARKYNIFARIKLKDFQSHDSTHRIDLPLIDSQFILWVK